MYVTALDKEMRSWETYILLEKTVKNMLTSLKAVSELQNPAIRERHWQQLMKSTKVRYLLIINLFDMFINVFWYLDVYKQILLFWFTGLNSLS